MLNMSRRSQKVQFTAIPMCIICGEKLPNESLKPAKLERHLSTRHADFADKPLAFFQRKARDSVISSGTQQKHNSQSKITLGIL